ncbi:DUF1659 domain-containing protein [Mesobacillus subterraneus]|jgi:hypothetical protein|uniref:DUF1659 domain-containing protein n=1 Tax=Mesobacillus subterraneus TaxID=285983 RepID=UPI002040EFF7|nr:DUF1659 domain-containing protein [Mesobacillus subterraneus]MCM3665089.1 DUF1659 domain-containing protein [Mesobacillus subterraneus]MCM3684102.1 DUF1659 domain-containing protein [Mesobacillus subterraneus]
MAMAMLKGSNIRLMFETGIDEKGEPIFKGKTYSNVKKEATADQVQQAALALGGLSANTLSSVERNDSFDII